MFQYKAFTGNLARNNALTRMTGITSATRAPMGSHRMPPYQGGRLMISAYNVANVQATATSLQAGMGVFVDSAALHNDNHFLSVSGLTACIGLMVLLSHGGRFVCGSTAHFNGDYDNAAAWNQIADDLGNIAGIPHAVVISTRDTSTGWQDDVIIPRFGQSLMNLGVHNEYIFFYHSCSSGVAFLVRRDGIMGEPLNHADFSY